MAGGHAAHVRADAVATKGALAGTAATQRGPIKAIGERARHDASQVTKATTSWVSGAKTMSDHKSMLTRGKTGRGELKEVSKRRRDKGDMVSSDEGGLRLDGFKKMYHFQIDCCVTVAILKPTPHDV